MPRVRRALSIETLRLDPPGEGEVRVRVLASSICHSDIIYMDGGWGGDLPRYSGTRWPVVVTDIGSAVRSVDIGVGDSRSGLSAALVRAL